MSNQTNQAKHTIFRVAFRFAAGRDLDGRRRTNATALRHGDRDLTEHGRAGRWAHRRHLERSLIRLGALAFVLASLYGLMVARTLTLALLTACAFAGCVASGYFTLQTVMNWKHHRHTVKPLFRTLAPMMGHPIGDSHKRYLTIPRTIFDNETAKVKLILSPEWVGAVAEQKAITGLVSRRLNLDLEGRWYHHAYPPFVEFSRAPTPPGMVSFSDFKPYMDKSLPHVIPMGLGSSKQLISINLDEETPHVALSIGTGGGKTTMMALVIAFLVRHGVERIDVINTKRSGYAWCKGLPGVFVHNNMAAQMKAIHDFHERMERRYDEFENDDTLTFPRQVLIIEEQNSWMKMAKKFWEDYRLELEPNERGRVPKANPAIGEIGLCLFMGRQACMNVISIFQRMSASAAGDGDMRDQYGAKLLARSSRQAWKILVGTTPVPKDALTAHPRGRAVYVLGDESHPIQIAYLTFDQAREYALNGRDVNLTGPGTPISGVDEMYSLREIADNVIPIKYAALRKAKQRDRERFPAAVATGLYRVSDIQTWFENRPGNKRAA